MDKLWQIRTDLASDASKTMTSKSNEKIEIIEGIKVIHHYIDKDAAREIGKPIGNYYTMDLSNFDFHNNKDSDQIELALSILLKNLLTELKLINKNCLVIGLGNMNITPDAVGPCTIENIVVTRHLKVYKELNEGYSVVSAFSPGVMGNTGIDTADIIDAVKNKADVDFIIVIDALSSSSISRVNKTIQITDTGISPGSGVGNKRKEVSFNTMRKPVIAIGVPTVVDAVTIAYDTLNYVLKRLSQEVEGNMPLLNKIIPQGAKLDYNEIDEPNNEIKKHFLGQIGILDEHEKRLLFESVLTPNGYNLMVTSKDIDQEVEDLSKIVAWGINRALHERIFTNEKS